MSYQISVAHTDREEGKTEEERRKKEREREREQEGRWGGGE